MGKKEAFSKMSVALQEGDADALVSALNEVLNDTEPLELIHDGMMTGLKKVGEAFSAGEIFLPEMLMAAEAFQEGMKVIEPKLAEAGKQVKSTGKVVFGTVVSDIHEIGKNIVITLMKTHGFDVIDLGANVSPTTFVQDAERANADVVALSALMTTTMTYQRDTINYLKERGLRDRYIVLVGGGPVDAEWAEQIGADGTSTSAIGAVEIAEKLIAQKGGAS